MTGRPKARKALELTRASDVVVTEVDWLWYPRIPGGRISIVGGKGGVGKGLLLADVAARITRGEVWPLSDDDAREGTVLWCEAEDDVGDTLVPRLIAARADLDRVYFTKPSAFFAEGIAAAARKHDLRLIVLSPLMVFLEEVETNDNLSVIEALGRLQREVGPDCAIVGIAHLNKKPDLGAVERLLGSVAFANFVRSVMLLNRDDNGAVRLICAKHNLSQKGEDLLFTPVNRRPDSPRSAYWGIEWDRPENNIDQDRLFDRTSKDDRDTAGKWLVEYLGDQEKEFSAITIAGEARGFSSHALRQAKTRDHRIKHRTEGFGAKKKTFWRVKA